MATGYIVRRNQPYGPGLLAELEKRLSRQQGVARATVLMATDENKRRLAGLGVTGTDISAATASDLVVVVEGDSRHAVAAALGNVDSICDSLSGGEP